MAEYSYPMLEQPLLMDQWRSVTLGIGSGVFDEGGGPYAISLDNVTNSATIRVDNRLGYAHAIVSGFYHKLDAPMKVNLPAVTKLTTYTIALCYEPLNTAKPVSLKVVTGALDETAGKEWLVLHKVTRQPNQLLTDAKVQTVKASIAPLINVRNFDDLPSPSEVLVSAMAFVSSEEALYRVSGVQGSLSWHRISGDSSANPLSMPQWDTSTTHPQGISMKPTPGGWECNFSGQIIRNTNTFRFASSGWSLAGTLIPPALRTSSPKSIQLIGAYYHGAQGIYPVGVNINFQTGDVSLRRASQDAIEIREGGAVSFEVTWTAPRHQIAW